jgi:hypothetical protein
MHAFRVSAQPLKLRYVRGSYPAGAESILSTHEYANSVNAISLLRARRERLPRRPAEKVTNARRPMQNVI